MYNNDMWYIIFQYISKTEFNTSSSFLTPKFICLVSFHLCSLCFSHSKQWGPEKEQSIWKKAPDTEFVLHFLIVLY